MLRFAREIAAAADSPCVSPPSSPTATQVVAIDAGRSDNTALEGLFLHRRTAAIVRKADRTGQGAEASPPEIPERLRTPLGKRGESAVPSPPSAGDPPSPRSLRQICEQRRQRGSR